MSLRPATAAVSVASTLAIGLVVAIGAAPPATAELCSSDPPPPSLANAGPAGPTLPWLPLGRKPIGANERAPLPSLGPLISAFLNAVPRSAPMQKQAAVIPSPNPPG